MPDRYVEAVARRSHVNLSSDADVAFWCEQFGVTPAVLISAVLAVGGSVRFVRLYLDRAESEPAAA